MRTVTQIDEVPERPGNLLSEERPVAGRILSIADRRLESGSELERARQINRIDALKVLIQGLLEQVDYLASPGEYAEPMDVSLQAMVRRFETELIRHALMRTGGKQRQAARLLGEKKTTLNAKIMRYGIKLTTNAEGERSAVPDEVTERPS
jgi:transcriptional regulator with GAF, ATPase, and Fis domain